MTTNILHFAIHRVLVKDKRQRGLLKPPVKCQPSRADRLLAKFRANGLGIRVLRTDPTSRCAGCAKQVTSRDYLGVRRIGAAVMIYCVDCALAREEDREVIMMEAGSLTHWSACTKCFTEIAPGEAVVIDRLNGEVTHPHCY